MFSGTAQVPIVGNFFRTFFFIQQFKYRVTTIDYNFVVSFEYFIYEKHLFDALFLSHLRFLYLETIFSIIVNLFISYL